jgi:hypothetical protein
VGDCKDLLFEAAFGKKPNLKGVCEWGEKVYVRIEGGTKLGGRVTEGKWLGMDDKSKGAWIYWPDSKTVTVECNIYYENPSAICFEEEVTEAVKMNADLPPIPETPRANAIPPIVNPNPPVIAKTVYWQNNPNSDPQDSSDAEPNEKRV